MSAAPPSPVLSPEQYASIAEVARAVLASAFSEQKEILLARALLAAHAELKTHRETALTGEQAGSLVEFILAGRRQATLPALHGGTFDKLYRAVAARGGAGGGTKDG